MLSYAAIRRPTEVSKWTAARPRAAPSDGKYWFTTYARADEILHFPTGGVHIRELEYSNYKAPASQ